MEATVEAARGNRTDAGKGISISIHVCLIFPPVIILTSSLLSTPPLESVLLISSVSLKDTYSSLSGSHAFVIMLLILYYAGYDPTLNFCL